MLAFIVIILVHYLEEVDAVLQREVVEAEQQRPVSGDGTCAGEEVGVILAAVARAHHHAIATRQPQVTTCTHQSHYLYHLKLDGHICGFMNNTNS